MAQITWKMEKATLTTDPESITTKGGTPMVKINVMNETFKKNGNEWEKSGEEHFEFIAFGEVATELSMYAAGEQLDLDGVIQQRTYATKWRKENKANNFIVRSFKVSEEN